MAARMISLADPARLMDEMLGTLRQSPTTAAMPMDLYRTGDHYVLSVDLPGADPGTVDVAVEDRTLTIRAERTLPNGADLQWLARERPTGTYVRQLTLARGLALDLIEASYRDGVLTLTIPVAEEAKPRKIEIQQHGAATAITAEHQG
jgi:HSP20 family protein